MTTTPTQPMPEYEDLIDLFESHPNSEDHQVDNSTGRVQKNNKYGNPTGRQYSNIGEYLDSLLHKDAQKVANIINNFDDLSQIPGAPYIATAINVGDFVNQISTNPALLTQCVNEFLGLTPPITVSHCDLHSSDKTVVEYQHNGVTETVNILELTEQLYLMQKISIANLNMVVQKLSRAQKRRERQENKMNNPILSSNTQESSSILQETHEELHVPQIQAALNFSKVNRKTGSAYSFDKKWFPVRYEKTVAGSELYYACIQDDAGNVTEINEPNTTTLIRRIMNETKKSKEKIGTPDTVDMGNEFSQSVFLSLCEDISKSKSKRGAYKLGGKEYIVTETVAAGTGGTPPAIYNTQYLGHTNTLSIHTGNATTISQYLKDNIHFHAPTEGSHVFSKKGFTDLCEHLEHAPNQRGLYEFEGHQYPVWIERGTLYGTNYHAEIPGEGGRTNEVSAGSAEKLYEKILKKAHKHDAEHKDEKKSESKEKPKEGTETKSDKKDDHGHGKHDDHKDEGGTKYDAVVNTIFGNGLIGKGFKGVRNMIPKGIRGLSGAAFDGAVASGVIGGLTYGAGIALGSAAIGTLVVPAMTISFAGYGVYSAIKRFNKWRAAKGGGDSHGGGHGGH